MILPGQLSWDFAVPPGTFSPEPAFDLDAISDRLTAAEQVAVRAGAVIELNRVHWNEEHGCFSAEALVWGFQDLESLGKALVAAGQKLLRK